MRTRIRLFLSLSAMGVLVAAGVGPALGDSSSPSDPRDGDQAPVSASPTASGTEDSIQLHASGPAGNDHIRDAGPEDEDENFKVDELVGVNSEVFAGVTWMGGDPVRIVYVKDGHASRARALLDEGGIGQDRYRLEEVRRSLAELESGVAAVTEYLVEHQIPYSSVMALTESGGFEIGAPPESPLVEVLSRRDASRSEATTLEDLQDMGVTSVTVQESFEGMSSLLDDTTPNMGSRISVEGDPTD